MVKKSILKDALRHIRFSKKRFIFLSVIVGLITSIYLGLNLTYPSLIKNANTYYDKNNIMDVLISSKVGFTKDDYDLIKSVPNTNGVMMVKTLNTKMTSKDKDFNIKAISISNNRNKNDNNYINRLILTNGKYPKTINEGLVEESFFNKNGLKLGDLITLKPENKNELKAKKIKIVGTVKSFGYQTNSMNLKLNKTEENESFIYLEERNFNTENYNDIYVTINKKNALNTYSKTYENLVKKYEKEVEIALSNTICERYNDKKEITQNKINSLQDKLNSYYTLDLPQESLNELIKQTSNDLENEKIKISNLKSPEIMVIKRSETKNFYDVKFISKQIKTLTILSPLILLPLLCLIYINFIANNIKEEKKEIEIKKAIGFSFKEISLKYILYVFLSALLGVIMGVLIFDKLILMANVLWLKSFFDIPFLYSKPKTNIIIVCILITTLTAVITCVSYLLCYNKKEKILKRKIAFKIGCIRKKLNFSSKMAWTNMCKSKTKLILQTSLIAFITTLFLLTITIKDSINLGIKNQYNKVFKYDLLAELNISTKEELNKIENDLSLNKNVKETIMISQSSITINGINEPTYLVIPSINEKLNRFINDLKITDNGIIISEKLAKTLNKKKNETLEITFSNGLKKKIKIIGITSNYTDNYVYMSNSLYKKTNNNEEPYFNFILIKLKDIKKEKISSSELLEINNITSVKTKDQLKKDKQDKLKIEVSYANLLIVLTFVLVFIVLYEISKFNLVKNKNKLKFLRNMGLYDEEIISFGYKENLIITIIGSLLGIILVNLIMFYIVKNIDIASFMFGNKINLISLLKFLLMVFLAQLTTTIFVHLKFIKNEDIK